MIGSNSIQAAWSQLVPQNQKVVLPIKSYERKKPGATATFCEMAAVFPLFLVAETHFPESTSTFPDG